MERMATALPGSPPRHTMAHTDAERLAEKLTSASSAPMKLHTAVGRGLVDMPRHPPIPALPAQAQGSTHSAISTARASTGDAGRTRRRSQRIGRPTLRVDTWHGPPPFHADLHAIKNRVTRPGHESGDDAERPATAHTPAAAESRDGSTRSGPSQRAMSPALSPFCGQVLLGRLTAARVDMNMPSRASHRACFAMFDACIDPLIDFLRMFALLAARSPLRDALLTHAHACPSTPGTHAG